MRLDSSLTYFPGTKIFHLDVDPLKQQMPRMIRSLLLFCFLLTLNSVFSIPATRRLKVGTYYALQQINSFLDKQQLSKTDYAPLFTRRSENYQSWRKTLSGSEKPTDDGVVSVPYLTSRLRSMLPQDTIYVLEAVTNAGHLIHHLNLTRVCITLGHHTEERTDDI